MTELILTSVICFWSIPGPFTQTIIVEPIPDSRYPTVVVVCSQKDYLNPECKYITTYSQRLEIPKFEHEWAMVIGAKDAKMIIWPYKGFPPLTVSGTTLLRARSCNEQGDTK